MKVLLTGASGFIGRAVLMHLRSSGHDVTCLIRSSGTSVGSDPALRVRGRGSTRISMRRFFARPSAVSFEATGRYGPKDTALRRSGSTPSS